MFIIYKTTNKINNKFYIGVHNNTRDWYKGSGSYLKRAIKKYGLEYFERETLYEFTDETAAYDKEREIVTYDVINDPLCYNLRLGGKGGKSGVTTVKDAITEEYIGSVSVNHNNIKNGKWVHILKGRDTFKAARVISLKVREGKPGPRKGAKLSTDTKEKIRKVRLGTKQSVETINKRSKALKGFIHKTHTCPHCGKVGRGNAMKQWHFDRCKQKH